MKSLALLSSILLLFFTSLVNGDATPDEGVRGEIVSCGGCSLGRYPEVRKFIKTEVERGAGLYQDLEVTFIPSKPPVLTIYNKANGETVEVIDLKLHSSSVTALHTLLGEKGFILKPGMEIPPEEEEEEDFYDDDDDFEYDDDDDDDFDDDDDDVMDDDDDDGDVMDDDDDFDDPPSQGDEL